MTEIEDQIRRGLRLVAEDLPAPAVVPEPRRRPSRRLMAVGVGLAATAIAVALALASGGGSRRQAAPRFLPDAFDYRVAPGLTAGGMFTGGGPGQPPYSVPFLDGVAATSASSAWAVGAFQNGKSVTWHWDGTSWRSVPLPPVPGEAHLISIATVDDGDAWAVGWNQRRIGRLGFDSHGVIEHWDGTRWRSVPMPYPGQSALYSVAASGPDDVWAVGESDHDSRVSFQDMEHGKFPIHHDRFLLLHWDGTTWKTVALPWGRPPYGLVFGANVAASGPSDVWVYSNGGSSGSTGPDGKSHTEITPPRVEHWNGARWEAVPPPFGPRDGIGGLSSTSGTDAWAVGSYRRDGHSKTLAARWDGRSWQIAPTPNRSVGSTLTGVVAVQPDDVWAIGESQWLRHAVGKGTTLKEPVALFEHWDGRRWRIMPGAKTVMDTGSQAIAATPDGAAVAVGSCSYDNVIVRWNGTAWQITPHPPDKYGPDAHRWRLSCSSPSVG